MSDDRTTLDPGIGPHPDAEALSAYVDGNLEPAELATVRVHLVACQACRGQVEDLELVREVVRGLPFVDPPFGFYERTLRLGPRPRSRASVRLVVSLTLGVVALVAVLAVVAIVRRQPQEIDPQMTVAASELGFAVSGPPSSAPPGSTPQSSPPTRSGAASPPDAMPATIAGRPYVGELSYDGDRYLVYGTSDDRLAVTWDEAMLDDGRFPSTVEPEPVPVATGRAWYVPTDRVGLLFVQRGTRAYTVVVGLGADVGDIADTLPAGRDEPSPVDRAESVGRSLLEAFGLGG